MRLSRLLGGCALALACAPAPAPHYPVAARPAPRVEAPPTPLLTATAVAKVAPAEPPKPAPPAEPPPSYPAVVARVAQMSRDGALQRRVHARGLNVVNVAWEDTARAQGSSLGPNISDLTLQARYRDERGTPRKALMPVIRFPNFSDRTGDLPRSKFFVRTGNHKKDGKLSTTALTSVLRNVRSVMSTPWTLKGSGSLIAERDTHFLVSAQAVFLPVPAQGKAEFTPVVFNYQSAPGSPAVLTLLVTRQGTSATIIENRGEDAAGFGGQELYFNKAGERARFTAERFQEVEARIEAQGGPKNDDERSAISRSADVIFLIQVPLVHRHQGWLGGLGGGVGSVFGAGGLGLSGVGQGGGSVGGGYGLGSVGSVGQGASTPKSDVDRAVVGHGQLLGPFREARGLELRRDARFPIRVTVQFYKATSNGVVSDEDLAAIEKSIGSVYEHADRVGSLVIPEDDPRRPTAWQTSPAQWFPW